MKVQSSSITNFKTKKQGEKDESPQYKTVGVQWKKFEGGKKNLKKDGMKMCGFWWE